jgi:hypothetical protein
MIVVAGNRAYNLQHMIKAEWRIQKGVRLEECQPNTKGATLILSFLPPVLGVHLTGTEAAVVWRALMAA